MRRQVGLGQVWWACQTGPMMDNLAFLAGEAAEPAKRHLPIPPWAFALLALAGFVVLLLITFAFRSTGTKH